jgi:Protein of unknown function (DUF2924)
MKADTEEIHNFDLTNHPAVQLENLWRQHLRERVPDHLPKSILAKLLAYRLQEQQHGGLSKGALAYLKVIEGDLRDGDTPRFPYRDEGNLKTGCQLVREYESVDHRVTVVEKGYEWQGQTFTSLSSVAKAITGTNWNGYRFFGLKAKFRPSAEATS